MKPDTRQKPPGLRTAKNLVGAKIRQARASAKPPISQDQLSGRVAALGVQIDRAGIAKIELGLRRVSDIELVALAKALRVDVKWLLGIQR